MVFLLVVKMWQKLLFTTEVICYFISCAVSHKICDLIRERGEKVVSQIREKFTSKRDHFIIMEMKNQIPLEEIL